MEYAAADDGSLAACTDCKEATGLHRATEQQVEKEKPAAIPAAATRLTGHSGLQRLSSVCADDVPALLASDRYPPDQAIRLPAAACSTTACLAASHGATLTAPLSLLTDLSDQLAHDCPHMGALLDLPRIGRLRSTRSVPLA